MRILNFSRITALCTILLILFPVSVGALSPEQKDVYSSGIYFFDTDVGSSGCTIGSGNLPGVVPEPYNGIFTAAGSKFNLNPALLAAIFYGGEHGNSFPDPPPPYGHGQAWRTSHTGAQGPFQFEPYTWPSYAQDGNGDGVKDVQDLTDASFAAADFLVGLGGKGNISESIVRDVAWKYTEGSAGVPSPNGSYANNVWAAFQKFSGASSASPSDQSASMCSSTVNLGSLNIKQVNAFGTADGLMGHPPTMIGVHYTAGNEQTVQDVISDLQDADGSKHCNHVTHSCSVQLTVLPDGSIYQLTSGLNVKTENIINFNDADIGIEIAGRDEGTLLKNQTQFNAVISLVAQLMQKYNIKMQQDFLNKAGLMGHMECDNWSDAHVGSRFTGQYSGGQAEHTNGHTDPGTTYMSKVRDAVGSAIST